MSSVSTWHLKFRGRERRKGRGRRGGLRQTSQHWEVSRNLEAASTPEKPESLREEDKRRWAIVEGEQKRKVVEEGAVREGGDGKVQHREGWEVGFCTGESGGRREEVDWRGRRGPHTVICRSTHTSSNWF